MNSLMHLDNYKKYWFPVATSSELKTNPLGVELLGKKLVIFRDAQQRPIALLDRCSHRGASLSKGKCESGDIVCYYHSWHFNNKGRCVKIPLSVGLKSIPSSFFVENFLCVEKNYFIWVCLDTSIKTEPVDIDQSSDSFWVQTHTISNCHFFFALENQCDFIHPYFTHSNHLFTRLAKQFGMQEHNYKIIYSNNGLLVRRIFEGSEKEFLYEMRFTVPNRFEFIGGSISGEKDIVYVFVTPINEHKCRTDILSTVSHRTVPNLKISENKDFGYSNEDILKEDNLILEDIHQNYLKYGVTQTNSTDSDRFFYWVKQILTLDFNDQCVNGEHVGLEKEQIAFESFNHSGSPYKKE